MDRRRFMQLAGLGVLGSLSSGTVAAQTIQTDADGFQDAAVLVGDSASRPDLTGAFLENKIRYGYIYKDFESHRTSYLTQDTEQWRPLPPFSPYVKDETQTVANTTTETEVVSFQLEAKRIFGTGLFDVTLHGLFSNASTNDLVTLRVYFGGTEIASTQSTGKNASNAPFNVETELTAHEHGEVHADTAGSWNNDSADDHHGAVTVDFDTATMLTVTVQWNNAKTGNTIEVSQGAVKRWR